MGVVEALESSTNNLFIDDILNCGAALWDTLETTHSTIEEGTTLVVRMKPWWLRPKDQFKVARMNKKEMTELIELVGFDLLDVSQTSFAAFELRAKKSPKTAGKGERLGCSVIVPCRNERGNIQAIFDRLPELGIGTELVFVDGNSTDGTIEEIERLLPTRPGSRLIHQGHGRGKGDAVRKGFAAATHQVLAILDADLTVPAEDMAKFFAPIVNGTADFVNGCRLSFPMEAGAMRPFNFMGNYAFGRLLSIVLRSPLKDALCGTKVLRKSTYEKIAANRTQFGEWDPFGDFDLLFGAARLGLNIKNLPIRYRARTYGETKINRFRDGAKLLKMVGVGFRELYLRNSQ